MITHLLERDRTRQKTPNRAGVGELVGCKATGRTKLQKKIVKKARMITPPTSSEGRSSGRRMRGRPR